MRKIRVSWDYPDIYTRPDDPYMHEDFEVDEDVMSKFQNEFEYTGRITEIIAKGRKVEEKQKYNIDTTLINKLILQEAGLLPENIIDSDICTVCHSDSFHSYRADKEESGRNGAIIGMM